ncbi:uncharacterized protein LOC111272476 isoform X2 [Varroa jacobsoni]|uniref:uncharacterized protein LOC111272476 isoform X2 n=1 Tax=Varroa jacobsoni TaxID=62625 RepID=UPI000BF9293D|nr:uncharacterized protein LOC111272476 isoform X2 [Varroa jacobsoni]
MCCVPIFSGAKNIVLVRQMHGSVHATVKRCHPRHANDPELWMSQFYMADFVRRFNDVRPSCSRPGASDPRKQTGCAPLLEMHWSPCRYVGHIQCLCHRLCRRCSLMKSFVQPCSAQIFNVSGWPIVLWNLSLSLRTIKPV